MRRKDREITEYTDKLDILSKAKILRIALVDGDKPYIIPMNFGYNDNDGVLEVFLHCASTGKKLDIINKNANISFEADIDYGIITGDRPEMWSYRYASVIGSGKAVILNDINDKKTGLDTLMKQCGYEGQPEYSDEVLKSVCVFKIVTQTLTAKSNLSK